jgi:hypothetical protein
MTLDRETFAQGEGECRHHEAQARENLNLQKIPNTARKGVLSGMAVMPRASDTARLSSTSTCGGNETLRCENWKAKHSGKKSKDISPPPPLVQGTSR